MRRAEDNRPHSRRFRRGCLALVLSAVLVRGASAAVDPDAVKRVLTLLTVVGEEYREGCDDSGTLVRPLEYEEARSFLAEARMRWQQLAETGNANDIDRQLIALEGAIEAKTSADVVLAQVAGLRAAVTAATGIAADVYPPQPPSPARGAAIFRENCASCHGERGDGQGPDAARLERKPANFTDPTFMRGETPYDHFHVVTLGKRGAAMPAWEDVLSLQERWDVLSYVWRLSHDRRELAEGQGVYLNHCANCHGAAGDGRGVYAAALLTPAPNFSQPASLARRTDAELYATVRDGVAGTAMPSFRSLTDDERWKAVAFLRALSLGGPDGGDGAASGGEGPTRKFGRMMGLLGVEYGKAFANGEIASPHDLAEAEVLLAQVTAATPLVAEAIKTIAPSDAAALPGRVEELSARIRDRAPADDVARLVHALASSLPEAPAATAPAPDALAETRRLLDAALAAYQRNDPQALSLASDAYFQFEPLESRLAGVAPTLKGQIEQRFLDLRGTFTNPGGADRAVTVIAAINGDLDAVAAALQPHSNPYALFVQSATIMLREGFEMVLVITALLAYVKKSGNSQMQRPIVLGALGGVLLSLATAYVFALLFEGASTNAAEALGGVSMLLASVVLFWVSYWLVSKAEADKWQRFIQGKVKSALSAGSGAALAGAAFLAVYREGVETVLFYQALFGSAPGATGVAVGGLIAGTVGLLLVYAVLQRFEMRIPIRQFFLGTSFLLYYMAIVFAGQGVAELQETGWISLTPVAGVPRIDFLGVYPTIETLLAQGVLIGLLFYAVAVVMRRRVVTSAAHADDAGAVLDEVRRLQRLAIEIRSDLAHQPTVEQAGRRLDTLIERVTVLEGQMQLKLPARAAKPAQV